MQTNSSLQKIFSEIPMPFKANAPDIQITGISIDSRSVKPGHLMVAMKVGSSDGHDYITKAIENGAGAVVGEQDLARFTVPYMRIESSRQALTWLAAAFYAWPAHKLTVIGVTGTDGKTTTSNLIYKILVAADIKAGMISTVNAVIGDEVLDTGFHVTTPDAHDVQNYLARMVDAGLTHVVLETTSNDFRVGIKSNLVGSYNVSNCLAALTATIYGLGIDPKIAASGIASLDGIPGRMEQIDLGQNFIAIVDFAHTPNALKVALETARKMTKGKVIATFGSAGLRDQEKRRMMAETSIELADLTVLTAEDPRTESLSGILEEMAAGARSKGGIEGETFWRVPDRGEAIKFAVRLAKKGDIVLSCGKGHEQSMCFGKTEYLWDDRIAMRAALTELLGVGGPKMPYLPSQDKKEEEWLK